MMVEDLDHGRVLLVEQVVLVHLEFYTFTIKMKG
jgi:hypothetical protein